MASWRSERLKLVRRTGRGVGVGAGTDAGWAAGGSGAVATALPVSSRACDSSLHAEASGKSLATTVSDSEGSIPARASSGEADSVGPDSVKPDSLEPDSGEVGSEESSSEEASSDELCSDELRPRAAASLKTLDRK